MNLKDVIENIFSVKNVGNSKQVCVLGAKIRFIRMRKIEEQINKILNLVSHDWIEGAYPPQTIYEQVRHIVMCNTLHQKAFDDKRFRYYGKDVYVCATGPTFDYYAPSPDAIHIGVNYAYKSEKIFFNDLFCIDGGVVDFRLPREFITYGGLKTNKFISFLMGYSLDIDPSDYKIYHFFTENRINYPINCMGLPDFYSVIFSAFAYALWTTPKRIFIVGADCSSGHANSLDVKYSSSLSHLVKYWHEMKKFADFYYPGIEIISVNPVGLKGLFKDVYTKEYIKANPELFKNAENITILE